MDDKDIPMSTSTMLQVIDTHQVDQASKYHLFEFVLVKYILESTTFLEPKLSKTELMIGCYFMKRQYKMGTGLGKLGDGFLVPIDVKIPGYQL